MSNRQAMSASPRPNLTFNVPNRQAMPDSPRAHPMNQRQQINPQNSSLQGNIGQGQVQAANGEQSQFSVGYLIPNMFTFPVLQGTFNHEFEALNQLHETVNNVVADVQHDLEVSHGQQELNRQLTSLNGRPQRGIDRPVQLPHNLNRTEVIQASQLTGVPAITRNFIE